MRILIEFLEKIITKSNKTRKIIYWKLKYGDRIKIGKNLSFRKRFDIIIENDGKLIIGDNNFFNNDCSITCLGKIVIGNNNLFGENVKLYDHNHCFNYEDNNCLYNFKIDPIMIGDYNWIGTNSVILKGTELKNRCVLGAGTILTRKLESYNILKLDDSKMSLGVINLKT